MELLRRYANQATILPKLQRLLALPQRRPTSVRPTLKQAQTRLTATQQAELLDRYLAGERAFQLAKAYGIHRHTVAQLTSDAGIRRPRSLTPDEIAECINLYAQGWSTARIGERLGRDHSTIWLALKKAGVSLRDAHGRDHTPHP